MLDLDTTEQHQAAGEITEPAKRWRNRFRSIRGLRDLDTSERIAAGAEFWEAREWPSAEIAEQKAADRRERAKAKHGHEVCDYLGAHPVDA